MQKHDYKVFRVANGESLDSIQDRLNETAAYDDIIASLSFSDYGLLVIRRTMHIED